MRKFKRVNNMRFGICILVMMLIISQAGISKIIHSENKGMISNEIRLIDSKPIVKVFGEYRRVIVPEIKLEKADAHKKLQKEIPKEKLDQRFTVTAYDLSMDSCGKSRGSVGFGITSSGFNLIGHTLSSARVISVDPSEIPIGSLVKIVFLDKKYQKYNATYKALDNGGSIKGKKIDLFIGDAVNSSNVAKEFGVTKCEIEIIKENN